MCPSKSCLNSHAFQPLLLAFRAGVLSTTGQSTNFVLCVSLPMQPGSDADRWVLQGTALLCMRDD